MGERLEQPSPLVVLFAADALVMELVGDASCQVRAVSVGDQLQHHVHGGGAARAGETVAVDLVDLAGAEKIGEFLLESRLALPMDGAAVALEEPRPCEEKGSGRSEPIDTPRRAARRRSAR